MVKLQKPIRLNDPASASCFRHINPRTRLILAVPPAPPRVYTQTHALLLHWEEDDIGVLPQLSLLSQVLSSVYHYTSILTCSIPSDDPFESVQDCLQGFIQKWSGQSNLLVVYYSGHGEVDTNAGLRWCAFKKPPDSDIEVPELSWTRLQKRLERTVSDTLLILDSCASSGSISFSPASNLLSETPSRSRSRSNSSNTGRSPATTEILAACGFETTAPGLGPDSFFNLLITELCCPSLIRREFSVAELHRRVLSKAVMRGGEARTPVYVRVRGELGGGSLVLGHRRLSDRKLSACIKESKRILLELDTKFQRRDDDSTDFVDGKKSELGILHQGLGGDEECPQLVQVGERTGTDVSFDRIAARELEERELVLDMSELEASRF